MKRDIRINKNGNWLDLTELPRKNGKCNKIDWANSVGYFVKFKYEDIEGEIEIVDYNKNKLIIKYLDDDLFEIFTGHFIECKLGKLLSKFTNEFKIKNHKEYKNIVILDRKHTKNIKNNKVRYEKMYKYKCKICGYEGWRTEGNLIKTQNCACCTNNVVVKNINDIATREPWMIQFLLNKNDAFIYTPKSNRNIKVKCPDCGRIKSISCYNLYRKHSIGCICGDGFSFGHKYIFKLLTQLKIEFIQNYSPSWCLFYNEFKEKDTKGEYDFIISKNKIIIEVDGGFHRNYNKMNKQTKEESEYIDIKKEQLANKNGYTIIRIFYDDENINNFKINVLKTKLLSVLNFNEKDINWHECEAFGMSNLCKQVYEYKKEHNNIALISLSKKFNISITTVRGYLKNGIRVWGDCNYNPKKCMEDVYIELRLKNSKKVGIFKDNIKLGEFNSITELERRSEELFGIKLLQSGISNVANGKQKQHKGFTFKFVDDEDYLEKIS